jgi:histidine triad (HIT) family protein
MPSPETPISVYDPNNIFARILRAELPCHRVYEDSETLAFMDIMPRTDGHVLIIPKAACRNLLDATDKDVAAAIGTTRKIAIAAKIAFAADGVQIMQYNEAPAGQVVFHLHFHVLPIQEGIALRPPGIMADPAVLATHADRLRQALAP